MKDAGRLGRTAKIIAAALLTMMVAAEPAEAVCEALGSSLAGMAGLRIGSAIGSRIGIAAGGTAIAATWPVGLTLGTVLATTTGLVLVATPAICLALAGSASGVTFPAVALAIGATVTGIAIVALMTENEAAQGVIGGIIDHLQAAWDAGAAWVVALFNGTTLEAASPETVIGEFVGPHELVGPIIVVPGWIHSYQPRLSAPGTYGMFPGVPGTGERF